MARRKSRKGPWLDRCEPHQEHMVVWVFGSPNFDAAALVSTARQEAIKKVDELSSKNIDRRQLIEDETFSHLTKLVRDLVNTHLGKYREDGPNAEFLGLEEDWHPDGTQYDVDRLIGRFVRNEMQDFDFTIVAEAILAHVKYLAEVEEK
jgi:hypothetical protein